MTTRNGLTLMQVAEALADGCEYEFWTDGIQGRFHKAPFPSKDFHTLRDGACSAITYRDSAGQRISPVMLLDELTDPLWHLRRIG